METIHLKPSSPQRFISQYFTDSAGPESKFFTYFQPTIKQLKKTAIGPYYWFIGDNFTGKMLFISDNCHELTPYTAQEWLNTENTEQQATSMMLPDDVPFIYASMGFAIENATHNHQLGYLTNVSVYARFEDAQKQYRWRLMQMPDFYFDEEGICQSMLVVLTDISHLPPLTSPFATMLVSGPNYEQSYRVLPMQKVLDRVDKVLITKREEQILNLMAKGLKTPEIVKALGIAYSTVENHKKNLRVKTNSKTSVELISYVLKNGLIG